MTARPLWAGLAIVSMWLAVLFVGVFGGSIESTSAGGGSSSVPVVVVVAGVAMVGTIVIGRRGFVAVDDELRTALEDEQRARAQLSEEVSALRIRLTS